MLKKKKKNLFSELLKSVFRKKKKSEKIPFLFVCIRTNNLYIKRKSKIEGQPKSHSLQFF
jgi:hypothetical protein